ncbi:MAG: hypothetical protein H0V84_12625 [Actinobacteria bacterium]|nr:hypothetical protein [Actinomycetota bacterium]
MLSLFLAQAATSSPRPAPTLGGTAAAARSSAPRAPAAPAVVLYDQYDTQAASDITSQDFEVALDGFDSFAADDFVVPSGQSWSITGVDVDGEYTTGGGPAASVNVFFYTNGVGSLPGALAASRPGSSYTGTAGDFVVSLSPAVALAAGTYWVSVQARQDITPHGQWFWHERAVQSNQGSVWQNPGNGFGTGCMTWVRQTACAALVDPNPDQVFRLNGTVIPTAVRITAFGASSTARGVRVRWTSASTTDVLGFEVWRQRGGGPLRKVNAKLIAAKPSGHASRYSFLDVHASPGNLHRYRLQVVTLSGARYWAGAATARALR